ncbi:MAG: helix-turn-helix domain protein [Ferruginibacter sp.]|uniref:helix-turn-helix domain-containing protein n=1 Tax=Ferruginibacter sp. TaxID=1940288 RepID=UPI00265B0A66|nr:helix-turn-helix transcriptional regulator [Ferruginibacter sp.]MDB5275893.1 helix-turn-helix domain protein [Ferruginibacter sp.]
MYGERIRYYRKQKGLSQAEMAQELNMEPASYSKIETNRTRLATDVLEKIAGILDVSPLAIMKDDPIVVNFNEVANNHGTVNSWINAETVFNYQKELVDGIVAARDAEITTLKNTLDIQQKLLQQQSGIIEKLSGGK